ncbi:hypothetical protein RDABS01_007996 [Bienertia sinuspersici]
MISKWETIAALTTSSELIVLLDLTKLTANMISQAAFGSSYKKGQKIFDLLTEQTDLAVVMLHSVYIPGQSKITFNTSMLPLEFRYIIAPTNRRFKNIKDHIQSSLCAIINKKKQQVNQRSSKAKIGKQEHEKKSCKDLRVIYQSFNHHGGLTRIQL